MRYFRRQLCLVPLELIIYMYHTTLVMCNFVNCMPYESVISDVDWVAAFAEKKEEEEKNRKMKVSSFSHRNCGSSM